MDEIKNAQQGSERSSIKFLSKKPKLREAARLALKQEQEMIKHLTEFHDVSVIHPIDCDFEKTNLEKYMQRKSVERTPKVIKAIRADLQLFKAFTVNSRNLNVSKDLLTIMVHNIDLIVSIFAKFVHCSHHSKGTIMEVVGTRRDRVRILLRGDVAIYEPISQRSLKNCIKNATEGQATQSWMQQLLVQKIFLDKSRSGKEPQKTINESDFKLQLAECLASKRKNISLELAEKILVTSGIINLRCPHSAPSVHHKMGELICSSRRPLVVGQPDRYEHSVVCLSDCYTLELEESVYRETLRKLDSSEEKQYIRALLKKFQLLEYFDAKMYVKSECMIQPQVPKKEKMERDLHLSMGSFIVPEVENEEEKEDEEEKNNKHKDNMVGSYEIKYTGDVYLIVEGQVTLRVDRIEQTKLTFGQQAGTVRHRQARPLLKLTSPDLFGFEEIGEKADYNLTYVITKWSKLLRLKNEVLSKHFKKIEGFQKQFNSMQQQRNELMTERVNNVSMQVRQEQLRRYRSLGSLTEQHTSPTLQPIKLRSKLIKHVEYVGSHNFDEVESKIKEELLQSAQQKALNIRVGEIVKSGAPLQQSLSFASRYRSKSNQICNVVGKYVEVRGKDGKLKRRKRVDDDQGQEIILRKLGVLSEEDRNKHNLEYASSRPSKFELGEFNVFEKEMSRLRRDERSLPKLGHLYSKKAKVQYNNLHKLDLK